MRLFLVPFQSLFRPFQWRTTPRNVSPSDEKKDADLMLTVLIPAGTLLTAAIGTIAYLGRRYIERRRDSEALALLIQAADLRVKLRQTGATLDELRALQSEALKYDAPTLAVAPK